jgi:hypothetical protein
MQRQEQRSIWGEFHRMNLATLETRIASLREDLAGKPAGYHHDTQILFR